MTPSHSAIRERGWMRRLLIWLLVLCVHTSSYAQMVRPILWGPHGAPRAGFTANGTLAQTTESVQNTDAVANFNAVQIQNSALLGSPTSCRSQCWAAKRLCRP